MTALKRSSGVSVGLEWTKSSYSSNDSPECVEVAATPGTVHVRDSKDAAGPRLTFTSATWAAFVSRRA
ncbi:DUF397 domain-containing protein [Streptomyces iconiensis]|uniref:DUF397 domain-containing protein n=1 Tax=Streptomyces iconiensis TaxID=1384038 RepID=A0ABT7A9F6_9ACTN|nr:DUF397 domain-containing protein [Streptomyces iconiensis]MDJ1137619.1 DUF397 domain-containing protein [Streptomyces iconiensis]